MCGIAGLLTHNSEDIAATANRMAAALHHRGPDDSGVWSEHPGVALAHRRLSILDLSPAGHQPMLSPSGRYVLTYNGEIYNFSQLRAQLAAQFRGHSDTEVLLAAVEEWGLDKALEQLNGMFAFALWDRKERKLTLVRDRVGEKPLYYGKIHGRFLFASELSAIKAGCAPADLNLNPAGVELLLRHNCIPAPYSIYEEISKLPPACRLEVNFEGRIKVGEPKIYWQPQSVTLESGSEDGYLEQTQALLSDSVRLRMVADVPVGCFLSGGIDSTLVTALMQAQSPGKVRTFTVGFDNAAFDESDYAQKIATHLGTDHTLLRVRDQDLMEAVPKMATVYSEPFSDSSQVPSYLIARLTRQHVTVVLSGDGGDELFAGYDRYATALALWGKLQALPLRRSLGRMLTATNPELWNALLGWGAGVIPRLRRGRSFGEKLVKGGVLLTSRDFPEFYSNLISQWQGPPLVSSASTGSRFLPQQEGRNRLRSMMNADLHGYLPEDILVKVDRATMSVSLESRIPLLDHRIVELSQALPDEMLVRQGVRKWILKRILSRYVPEPLFTRPKMGFGVPLGEWLRGPLKSWADDLLAHSPLQRQGLFDAKQVSDRWSKHRSGGADYAHDLWPILMFQAWHLTWNNSVLDQKIAN